MKKDVFICHASEDKASIVRPLVNSLSGIGVECWLDEAEISLGDSITEKVNEGLKISSYIIVILSRSFLTKNWPKKELWSVLNIESKSGRKIIIPIVVGTSLEVDSTLEDLPLLNDKLFLLWDGDVNKAANSIKNVVFKVQENFAQESSAIHNCGHCQTPFQYGVHVCLGCQGTIVYGLTLAEKQHCFKVTIMILGVLSLLVFSKFYSYIDLVSLIGIDFGTSSFPIIFLCIVALASGTAYFFTSKIASMRSGLIRTFR